MNIYYPAQCKVGSYVSVAREFLRSHNEERVLAPARYLLLLLARVRLSVS